MFHHTLSMFSHYLGKVNSSNLLQILKKMHFWTHLVVMPIAYLLIVCFNFWFLLNTCPCHSSCYPWWARCQGNSSSFNRTTPLHTGHATLCDFSSRQHRRSFHRIFGQRTAPTLIRLITGSGASSSSESTSRGFTTLTNWNSVCSKCGVTSTRVSLTMQLTSGASVFVHCVQANRGHF